MTNTELKPCLFCRGAVIIRRQQLYSEIEDPVVYCPSCRLLVSFADGETEEQLVELWNKRTGET